MIKTQDLISVSVIYATLFGFPLCAASAEHTPSIMNTGFLGLNTTPSARMDKAGTVRIGTSTSDPYTHIFAGAQIAPPLYISLRQTMEARAPFKPPDRLYPGVDIKLRVMRESAYRPAIALGLQSAFGHKKTAGEFIALSKRYHNFDFTAGLGWGRYGTAAHIRNPLGHISNHFFKNRDILSEIPNGVENWFTGSHAGFFGGVEYYTPINGLSLKFDYGADRYSAEKQSSDYNAPAPWGAGLTYSPTNWISAGIGTLGGDKISGFLTLQSNPSAWPFTKHEYKDPLPFYIERSSQPNLVKLKSAAENDNIELSEIRIDGTDLYAILDLPPTATTAQHLGRAARHIARYSGPDVEAFHITPKRGNIQTATITLQRTDVEKALENKQGSPQEIWKHTDFAVRGEESKRASTFLPNLGIKLPTRLAFSLENTISLSEDDHGALYRSSAFASVQTRRFLGLITGGTLRINIADNLHKLKRTRPRVLLPIRSDVYDYAEKRIAIENIYTAHTYSITPELHVLAAAGYLEEAYAGAGGEILYRPFGSRFAVGAEGWALARRDSHSTLNMELDGTRTWSAYGKAWYDIPKHDITAKIKGGRYLAGDLGFSASLEKRFKNGASLSAEVVVTNFSDYDSFLSPTHNHHKISLTLPLGSASYTPQNTSMKTTLSPVARNLGQEIEKPLRLYDITTPLSLPEIANHWTRITE